VTRAATVIALLGALACDGSSASRDVADRFVARYYDPARVADALPLTTGPARDRVAAELDFMKGVPVPPGAAPVVSLRRHEAPAGGRAVYGYDVQLTAPKARTLVVRLVVVQDGAGGWLVAGLDEKDPRTRRRAPAS
jgi:hypothetical protein